MKMDFEEKVTGIKIVKIPSNLKGLDGNFYNISIRIDKDNIPRAIAFFDIDKTLAHLDILYREAIHKLFPEENKEELINTLIFIGDSIRGDIGSGLLFCKNNPGYFGYGILVLSDIKALTETRHLVNKNESIHNLVSKMPTYALVISEVPKNKEGDFSLLSIHSSKFFFKL